MVGILSRFLLGPGPFSGAFAVSFRECRLQQRWPSGFGWFGRELIRRRGDHGKFGWSLGDIDCGCPLKTGGPKKSDLASHLENMMFQYFGVFFGGGCLRYTQNIDILLACNKNKAFEKASSNIWGQAILRHEEKVRIKIFVKRVCGDLSKVIRCRFPD